MPAVYLSGRRDSKLATSTATHGLSHSRCLPAASPSGLRTPGWLNLADQCAKTAVTAESTGARQLSRISSWRRRVPAADAKKAEGASDDTRRIPRPPFLTGRLACSHWVSVRSVLDMSHAQDLSRESNRSSAGCPLHGDARSVWSSFGALNDERSSISASSAVRRRSLPAALARSTQRLVSASSIAAPVVTGVP